MENRRRTPADWADFNRWLASTGVSLEVQRAMAKHQRLQQHADPPEKGVPAPAIPPPVEQDTGTPRGMDDALSEAFTEPATFNPRAAFMPGTPKSNS